MTKVILLDNKIINIGDWDYQIQLVDVIDNPFPGPMQAPEDWDFQIRQQPMITNPLPEGAVEDDREVVESAKGRLLLADDWYNLREDAYPPLADQLDAFWKGGDEAEFMAALIADIKAQYPKPA